MKGYKIRGEMNEIGNRNGINKSKSCFFIKILVIFIKCVICEILFYDCFVLEKRKEGMYLKRILEFFMNFDFCYCVI